MSCYLSSLYVSSLSSKLLLLVLKLLPSRLCVYCMSLYVFSFTKSLPFGSLLTLVQHFLPSLLCIFIPTQLPPVCLRMYFHSSKKLPLGSNPFSPLTSLYFFPLTFFSSPNPSSLLPKFLPFYIIPVSEPFTHLSFFSLVL
jgi:hypothetical protein